MIKKLLLSTAIIFGGYSLVIAAGNKTVDQITFSRDGTTMTTASSGSGGDNLGNHIATKTITAGFGISATTGVFSSSITAQSVIISSYPTNAFIGYQPTGGFRPIGWYGNGTANYALGYPLTRQDILSVTAAQTSLAGSLVVTQSGSGLGQVLKAAGNRVLGYRTESAGTQYQIYNQTDGSSWNAFSAIQVDTMTNIASYNIGRGSLNDSDLTAYTTYFSMNVSTLSNSPKGALTITNNLNIVAFSSSPWLSACGTSTLGAGSSNSAGVITFAGALAQDCTVNFGGGGFAGVPSCPVWWTGVYTLPPRISAISSTSFTFSSQVPDNINSGLDTFGYVCIGTQAQ